MVKKGGSPPPPRVFGFYPPRAVLPRQTFLTHCVLHCAVTDSLARGCSWNHGRNTAKCSVVCVYSTRARRAFSCRPGRSVYTIVLVVPWCYLGWHYIVTIVYSNAAAAMACAHCKKKMSGRIGRTSPRQQQQQRTMGTKKGGTRRKSSCSPPHENNIVIGWYYTQTQVVDSVRRIFCCCCYFCYSPLIKATLTLVYKKSPGFFLKGWPHKIKVTND